MILVHHHRDMRKLFGGRQNQMTQERGTGIFPGAGGGLHNHRGIGLVRGFHDGAHLFHVIDVKGRYAIAIFGGVIQQLSHAYECHCVSPSVPWAAMLPVSCSVIAKTAAATFSSVFRPRFQHGYRRQHLAFHEFQKGTATG